MTPQAAPRQPVAPQPAASPPVPGQSGTETAPPKPRPEPPGLRERVENEPLIQEFVRVMRGEITSVEEPEDRS